jgi:hypothetical protein
MTTLLCYLRSEGKYEKWKSACKRALSHILLIDEILSVLKGKKASECSTIISNIADILLLTTSRQAHRAFFPILLATEACATIRRGRVEFNESQWGLHSAGSCSNLLPLHLWDI